MQTKPEVRRSERFGHAYIIKLEDDMSPTPYYALSQDLSETGMQFKSLFELHPGFHLRIVINDKISSTHQVIARVVWCKELGNAATFPFAVGVEFFTVEKHSGANSSPPITQRMRLPVSPVLQNFREPYPEGCGDGNRPEDAGC
jgi:hypothetical protein